MSAKSSPKKAAAKKKPDAASLPPAAIGYLSIDQVGAMLGVSERTLFAMIRGGRFPKHDKQVGKLHRWSLPLVNRTLAEGFDATDEPSPGSENLVRS